MVVPLIAPGNDSLLSSVEIQSLRLKNTKNINVNF